MLAESEEQWVLVDMRCLRIREDFVELARADRMFVLVTAGVLPLLVGMVGSAWRNKRGLTNERPPHDPVRLPWVYGTPRDRG